MTLIVNGSVTDRIIIYDWLREICDSVQIDRLNGDVFVGAIASTSHYTSGCNSLRELVLHHRTVTINALPGPTTPLPPPHDSVILKVFNGGVTLFEGQGGIKIDYDTPGRGVDEDIGTNADVFIDMSNNNGTGYDHGAPMWLVLAHELTGGHAFHAAHGTSAKSETARENQAIDSENGFRTEHGLGLRLKEAYDNDVEDRQ